MEEEMSCEDEQLEGSSMPIDEELLAMNRVESIIDIEELKNTLVVGQVVENEHIAYALYCKYASMLGFSVRKGKNVYFKDGCGLLQGKFFYCNCEGHKDYKRSKDKVADYTKTSSRCGCMARLKITRKKHKEWKVAIFVEEHNHPMFPQDLTYLLRSSRGLTDKQLVALTAMVKSGISVSQAMNVFEDAAQGKENVGFIARDAYDCIYRAKRKTKIENADSFELMQHFREKSVEETDYYWNVEVDDDNRLMNFFLRDYRCLIDYGCVGDVISIDTTYKTNKFDMICALFVGINHHHENVLFGFALLSDETESTFRWLFKTFLDSMGNKQPATIFTDQCQAMMNAVDKEFPTTHHRLCQWHINQNAPSHFGSLNSDSSFRYMWTKCMNLCESKEEFEATWKEMTAKYNIGEQSWFATMYKLRERWATAFSSHIFSGGLLATSRSEGTNSALKKNIKNRNASVLECVLAYEKLQDSWRVAEKEKDALGRHNKPTLLVSHPLLKHAVEVYTVNIYKIFEKEMKNTMSLEHPEQCSSNDGSLMQFKVKPYDGRSRCRIVEYDPKTSEIRCSCHHFETHGILCSHALKVLIHANVHFIPDRYIKKRWTKDVKSEMYTGNSKGSGKSDFRGEDNCLCEMAFVSHATSMMRELAMQGKSSSKARDILKNHLEKAKKEINALPEMSAQDVSGAGKEKIPNDETLVRDPVVTKSRGVTNVRKRHWEVKRKKEKKKIVASKDLKNKRQEESSMSQPVPNRQPWLYQYSIPFSTNSFLANDIIGNPSSESNDLFEALEVSSLPQ